MIVGDADTHIYIWNVYKQINACLAAARNSDGFIDDAFVLASIYNDCINLSNRYQFGGSAQICSISFTSILLPPPRVDVKYILQVALKFVLFVTFNSTLKYLPFDNSNYHWQAISLRRSEQCCLILISSLLASCQIDSSNGNGSDSDTSSIEILKALTSHMSSGASPLNQNTNQSAAQDPSMAFFDKIVSNANEAKNLADVENVKSENVDYLDRMVSNEENYFAFILLKCLQLCPMAFGKLWL